MSSHSPAEILRAALVSGGMGVLPSTSSGAWPVFVDHMPDTPNASICVYGTTGTREGRIMRTGESVRKPGWQIRIRAGSHTEVWAKAQDIQTFLDGVKRLSVTILGETFVIKSVTQTGDALSLGVEPDGGSLTGSVGTLRRNNVTINGTITL